VSDVLTIDLQRDLLTVRAGAELAGVSVSAVRKWMTRGYTAADGVHVRLRDHGVPGCPRVLGIEVLRAEAATRARAGRVPFPPRAPGARRRGAVDRSHADGATLSPRKT